MAQFNVKIAEELFILPKNNIKFYLNIPHYNVEYFFYNHSLQKKCYFSINDFFIFGQTSFIC